MVAKILIIASVACVINLANGSSAPFPGFKPCKASDDTCILQNTNIGIPYFVGGLSDFGIKSSDPDHYDKVDCSTPNMKFILTDVIVTGLKNCKAVNAKRDESKLQMIIGLQCNLKLEGNYEIDGKMAFGEFIGKDKIRVEIPNIISTVTCNYNYKDGKDGKKYIRIKNFEHKYELKEKATLVFEGLFPHNEVLRTATNEVIKNYPNEIIKDLGSKMFQAVVKRMVGNMNNLLVVIPNNELSLD